MRDQSGNPVYPYRSLVKKLVTARSDAARTFGSQSLLAKYFKFTVNSLYGKVAQHVKKMYSSKKRDYKESEITNNVSASLITAFVRSVLFATYYEVDKNGYKVYRYDIRQAF